MSSVPVSRKKSISTYKRHVQRASGDPETHPKHSVICFDSLKKLNTLFANHYTHATAYANWEEIMLAKKESLYKMLRKMIESHKKSNIQICINNRYFDCHLCVLQVYSKFFEHIDQGLVVKLPANKISPATFDLIYKWMLSDDPYIERKHLLDIFIGATYLDIRELLTLCWYYLADMNCFAEDTACRLYAKTGNNPALEPVRVMMLTRITRYFLTYAASRAYVMLPERHLLQLLSSNSIGVHSEIEILFVGFRWLAHKWNKRLEDTKLNVMNCVRFQLMPLWFLEQLAAEPDFEVQPHHRLYYCVHMPVIAAKIKAAIDEIHAAQLSYKESDYMQVYVRACSSKECLRQVIYDPKCPYLSQLKCSPSQVEAMEPLITYNDFSNYLKYLHVAKSEHWKNIEVRLTGAACMQNLKWSTQ